MTQSSIKEPQETLQGRRYKSTLGSVVIYAKVALDVQAFYTILVVRSVRIENKSGSEVHFAAS